MSKATLIVLCALGAVCAHTLADSCSTTDQTKTKTCLDAHFGKYGIDAGKALPKFNDYIATTVKHLEQHGAAGFDLYCEYGAALATCLGALKTSACMKAEGFDAMYGLGKDETRSYATSFPVEAYTCEHKQEAKSLVACTWNASQSHPEPLRPLHDNHFVKYCKEDVRSFICNQQKVALNFSQDGHCEEKLHKC
ncbi:hypothetical protein PRIPAC_77626 [Pristionchus pacificus]|uniref:Uncharacterized protein n=1 Tax=Pristionchus pacificus TaxID=54126 RepID=A0A2A6CK96_PRIPA|nr:hypothetical protein PRIPAC_77626 [Pristionchus pacificus]|eukprot:PDM78644.1 hypothetical protein PRIPAC_31223 [Pristionchus pacificus]